MKTKIRVLHIDDNEHDRKLVKDALRSERYLFEVVEADNREKFEIHLADKDFDIILSDFNILGFDGLQVLQIVKEKYSDLPVIILTGTGSEEIAIQAMMKGAADYVIKKVSHIRGLAHTIEKVMENKKLVDDRRKAEVALELAHTELENLHNSLDEAIFSFDVVQNKMLIASSAHEAMFGYPPSDFFKSPQLWYELVVPEDKPIVDMDYPQLYAGKNIQHQVRVKHQSGQIRWIEAKLKPVMDAFGNLIRVDGIVSDITDRIKAEKDLQISEKKHRDLAETVNAVTWEFNLTKNKWDYVAPQSYSILGYKPEEWENFEWWAKNIYAEDRQQSVDFCVSETALKRNHNFEYRFLKKDGTIIWLRDIVTVFVQNETPTILRGIMIDISEQKKALEALTESEEKYRHLFANNPQPMWIYDLETLNFIEVNLAAVNHYGYSREEFLSMTIKDIRPSGDIPALMKDIENTRSDHNHAGEWRHMKKNGEVMIVEITSHSLIYNERKARHVLVIDITERKLAEGELLKLSHAVDQSPASIIISDLEGNIEYVNRRFIELSGYTLDEVKGKSPRILQSGEMAKEGYKKMWDTIQSGKIWTGEFQNKKKNGELIWVSASISPVVDSKGAMKYFLAVEEDITDKIRMMENLMAALEKAQESDRLKLAFLANMSHEIRTPMNGILGFAELLKEPGLTGEQQLEYIGIIEKSGARMLNIINDIIDISKIESGQMIVSISETNVNEQVEFIYNFFRLEAENKGINLSIKNNLPASEAMIQTDKEKLYAVLSNLVKNAIKYTDKGSIEFGYDLVVETLHATSLHATSLQFYVKDTGIGIPIHRQEAIFERFIQADIVDKMARQGAGLGLSIAKAYAEMLGGRLWVESEPGIGSVFRFTIPYHLKSEEKVVPKNVDLDNNKGTQIKSLNILIAEDDEGSANLLATVLRKISSKIFIAKTGIETVEAFRNNPDIDLVLMDIQMPEMDGYEATRQIREFNKNVIIIAQTAYALSGDNEKATEAGCNDYISKPIKSDTLIDLIREHLK